MPGLEDWVVNLIIYGIVVAVLIIALFLVMKLIRRGVDTRIHHFDDQSLKMQDLKKLEGEGLLSAEEMKRVREAMARRFLEETKEKEERERLKGVSALEELRLEAEKTGQPDPSESEPPEKEPTRALEEQPAPSRDSLPPPPDSSPAQTTPSPVSPSPTAPSLPERLRSLAAKSEAELEDLLNAGFLEPQDYELILAHRKSGE